MAVYFFDSSTLVKRYIHEPGSAWVQTLCQQTRSEDLYIARIAGAEVISAIARRGRAGDLSPRALATALARFRQDFATAYEISDLSPTIVARAMLGARRAPVFWRPFARRRKGEGRRAGWRNGLLWERGAFRDQQFEPTLLLPACLRRTYATDYRS